MKLERNVRYRRAIRTLAQNQLGITPAHLLEVELEIETEWGGCSDDPGGPTVYWLKVCVRDELDLKVINAKRGLNDRMGMERWEKEPTRKEGFRYQRMYFDVEDFIKALLMGL